VVVCPDVALIKVVSVSIYYVLRVDRSHTLLSQPRERLYNVIPSEAGNANGPEKTQRVQSFDEVFGTRAASTVTGTCDKPKIHQ